MGGEATTTGANLPGAGRQKGTATASFTACAFPRAASLDAAGAAGSGAELGRVLHVSLHASEKDCLQRQQERVFSNQLLSLMLFLGVFLAGFTGS